MKNQAKLKNLGLVDDQGKTTEKYYYLKFGQNTYGYPIGGVATVCVIPLGTLFARGVAFCNPIDQFNRRLGRAIALGRAIKAIESHQVNDPIPNKAPCSILSKNLGWDCLSAWAITLTRFERQMFKGVTK